ncbi:MAG: sigma factor-like helix-turn-helix DNA-binding protein [Saccharofermentanales bacterium]
MIRPTDRIDEYIDLKDAIATLPTRQRRAVVLYSLGMTQAEIAGELQITQSAVSQLLEKAVVTYKSIIETHIY